MKKLLLFMLISSTSFSQTQIGADIDRSASNEQSGTAISISENGSILAISARHFQSLTGATRVYQNNNGSWTQLGNNIVGEGSGDYSSYSLCLSSDGTVLAIGAPANDGTFSNAGHVRVYKWISGNWTKIGDDIDGVATNDQFGESIAMSEDGNTIAIGASANDGNGNNSGYVRIFKNVSNSWIQIGNPIYGKAGQRIGNAVGLSNNGETLVIGAYGGNGNTNSPGFISVYQNIQGAWTQKGSNIFGVNNGDYFGISVAISGDGETIAGSAHYYREASTNSLVNDRGLIRTYKFINNIWTQFGGNILGDVSTGLGWSISLSDNGKILAAGGKGGAKVSPKNYPKGYAKIAQLVNNVWTFIGTVDGESELDQFGYSVSLAGNGSTVAVGGPFNDNSFGGDAGHVRVYSLLNILSNESFIKKSILLYPNPTKNSISIDGDDIQKIKIFNSQGQLIRSLNYTSNKLDLSNLQKGIYFIELIDLNGGKKMEKIIKN
jgi:hypothetical protein